MGVSFTNKLNNESEEEKVRGLIHPRLFSKVNESNMSIKFGDCSAVGPILLSDKSLFEEDHCKIN